MKTNTLLAAAILVVASCKSNPSEPTREAPMTKTTSTPKPAHQSGRKTVNGIDYYYEIHGEGEPLLVLHGGLMSIETSRGVLPAFAEGRKVIAVDAQGHGRTTLGDRPITLENSANDMNALLETLGYPQADVLGYSFGAGIALRLAVQHPQRVRRLVLVSAPFARDGWYADMLPQQAAVNASLAPVMKDTPIYQSYAAIAPNPGDFPKLLDRMGELMRTPYNYAEDVKKLAMPVMLVFGDSDMVPFEHITEFYKLLGGGKKDAGWQRENMQTNRLAILADKTHYEMFDGPQVATVVRPFLDGKTHGQTNKVSSR
jgi:pimeloyl-ACP methyl ester carboxylesterase